MAENTLSTVLKSDLEAVKGGLPADFNIQRFVNNAIALLNGNDTLKKFVQKNGTAQVKNGLMQGAYLGLDALRNEFYLIPYGDKLDFRIDYRGEQKLVEKYSIRPVKEIYAKVVRQGDDFQEKIVNGVPTIDFMPMPFNANPVIGAFAVCLFEDGGLVYEAMNLEELEAVKKKSQKSAAWAEFTNEMYKKAVLRRLCKHIKIDFETPTQQEIYNEDMAIVTQPNIEEEIEEKANAEEFVIDGQFTETEETETVELP